MNICVQDHSKWAITHAMSGGKTLTNNTLTASRRWLSHNAPVERPAASAVRVLCMGDINRAGHQLQRGGGAICFSDNADVWSAFLGIVAEVGKCGEL